MTLETQVCRDEGVTDRATGTREELVAIREAGGTTWVRASDPNAAATERLREASELHTMSINEVMKKLTVVATIVLPLTFVVGVYGMNVEGSPYNMPELSWTFGYPAVVVGMGLTAAAMMAYVRWED